MTQPQSAQPDEMRGVLTRLHLLGAATERMFSRVYRGLNRRNVRDEQETHITQLVQQVKEGERRYRALAQMAKERGLDIARLQAVLDRISEGVILQSADGRIIYSNAAAEGMMGSVRNFWRSELGQLFTEKQQLANANAELAPLGEAERVTINNRVLSVQVSAITDDDNTRIGTIMLLSDVTQETLAQRMRDGFHTHISHELKTPITSATYAKEFLMSMPQDQPVNRKMLEKIGRNVDILARLVDDMIQMSMLNSNNFSMTREPLALDEVIAEVVEGFAEDIHAQKLEALLMLRDVDTLRAFQGDRKYIPLLLSQLVRNAILYNEPQQQIIIAAGIDNNNPNLLFLRVADTGVGIKEEDLPHIFDLYYRGEPRTRKGKRLDPRGLGQGLYLAKMIAQAHGGYINAQSTVGEGSRFTVSLPIPPRAALPR